jgi:uncharacterized OB-fold protein
VSPPPPGASRARVPAVDGLFRADEPVALIGGRCDACGTYSFPRATLSCPNPACTAGEAREVELSRRGRLWSYTDARYPPPPPFVAKDPYHPFAIAAVELEAEQMVVLGQVVAGVGAEHLWVGCEMELTAETLYEDEEREYMVWKWRPLPDDRGKHVASTRPA